MGLDGGTKITRSDVLRGQSWRMAQQDSSRSTRGGSLNHVYQEKQIDEQVRRTTLWTTCALSGLPLQPPVVADAVGQLFNKQAILEHLLAAKSVGAAAAAAGGALATSSQRPALPAAVPAATSATGSIVPYSAPAAAAKELAAACLRYENQQRAAAAASAAGCSASSHATFDHIKSLKDVFAVQLTPNPDAQPTEGLQAAAAAMGGAGHGAPAAASRDSSSASELPSPWMCPVTLQPCGSKQPFSALRPCGHVLSQKALTALTATAKAAASKPAASRATAYCDGAEGASCSTDACCPVCEVSFDPVKDTVLINGSQQHMDAVRVQLREAAAAKAKAKQKKRKGSVPGEHGLPELPASKQHKVLQLTHGSAAGTP